MTPFERVQLELPHTFIEAGIQDTIKVFQFRQTQSKLHTNRARHTCFPSQDDTLQSSSIRHAAQPANAAKPHTSLSSTYQISHEHIQIVTPIPNTASSDPRKSSSSSSTNQPGTRSTVARIPRTSRDRSTTLIRSIEARNLTHLLTATLEYDTVHTQQTVTQKGRSWHHKRGKPSV